MKTTLDLPDDVMKSVKLRAVEENRTLTDRITEMLRRGLAEPEAGPGVMRNRVKFPLVEMAPAAKPGGELTPEQRSDILLMQEAEAHNDLMR